MSQPTVHFDEKELCWWTPVVCEKCGGYRHDLPLSELSQEDEALFQAYAVHSYPSCLSCESARWRSTALSADGRSLLWWDAQAREWMLWTPVAGIADGVTLPLGVRYSGAKDAAEVAAYLLTGDNPLPLRIVDNGAAADPDLPYLSRSRFSEHFELWLPCFACNGVLVPLHSSSATTAVAEALECFKRMAESGCPQCRTLSKNSSAEAIGLWYDTIIHDWVIRLPDDEGALANTALGLDRYGASGQEIARAAQQVMTSAASLP